MKHLSLFFFLLILAAVVVHADFACYDPVAGADFCTPFASEQEASILCCGQEHCDAVAEYEPSRCEKGCCTSTCEGGQTKDTCVSGFVRTDSGFCDEDLFPDCTPQCCCVNNGYQFLTKDSCATQQGEFHIGVPSVSCAQLCDKPCVSGCSDEKPLFCEDGKVTIDCTGGDGIVGNGNDCGCTSGSVCQADGSCRTEQKALSCKQRGKVSCSGVCVDSCDSCVNKPYAKNGECRAADIQVCPRGQYDNYCHAQLFMDLDRDGCQDENPCTIHTKTNYSLPLLVMALFIVLFILWKRRKKPAQPPPPVRPPENYAQRYSAYNQYPPRYRGN